MKGERERERRATPIVPCFFLLNFRAPSVVDHRKLSSLFLSFSLSLSFFLEKMEGGEHPTQCPLFHYGYESLHKIRVRGLQLKGRPHLDAKSG